MHVGIAGEVRCVVTKADGEVKVDTGFQKNLILNQGLDFFGGGKGNNINASCVIGSGNSVPAITQTKLDAYVAIANGIEATSDTSYVDRGDNLYPIWEQKKYRFAGLSDVNISEVGLVSTGTSANYYLTTRALIKDSLGVPTSISVKTGETLDIYYKIHKVVDTRDKNFVVNILDGDGGKIPYNVVIRLLEVGNSSNQISRPVTITSTTTSTSDLAPITSLGYNAGVSYFPNSSSYVTGSYKLQMGLDITLNQSNIDIRTLLTRGMGYVTQTYPFQMRLGRVSDDAPLTKTANDTLYIPLEFSWGRFEGEL